MSCAEGGWLDRAWGNHWGHGRGPQATPRSLLSDCPRPEVPSDRPGASSQSGQEPDGPKARPRPGPGASSRPGPGASSRPTRPTARNVTSPSPRYKTNLLTLQAALHSAGPCRCTAPARKQDRTTFSKCPYAFSSATLPARAGGGVARGWQGRVLTYTAIVWSGPPV